VCRPFRVGAIDSAMIGCVSRATASEALVRHLSCAVVAQAAHVRLLCSHAA
jgi:hypothetical protein